MRRLSYRRYRQLVVASVTGIALLAAAVAFVPSVADAAHHQRHGHHHHGSTTSGAPTTRPNSTTAAPTTTLATTTTSQPPGQRPIPTPLYGITFDNDAGISTSALAAQVATVEALPHMPTVRIVLDTGTTPSDYTQAITALRPHAYLMAELVDSSDLKSVSASAYHSKTASFVAAFGNQIDIWEVGNEVNGNWTGPYASTAAKITDAFNQVKAAGDRAALTLWENSWGPDHCGDGTSELTAQDFSAHDVPAAMRAGLDYVFVSWYPTQCSGLANIDVPVVTISAEMAALHGLYPNAQVGFGELGLPNATTSGTLSTAQNLVGWYYPLKLGLSYYTGGYFWWYGAQDAVPTSKPLFATLHTAMQ